MAADAYVLDLTANTLTKNTVSVQHLESVFVAITLRLVPTYPGETVPVLLFNLRARAEDTAGLIRIQGQGPSGLIPAVPGVVKVPVFTFTTKRGDTLQLANVPGSITDGVTGSPPLSEANALDKVV